MLDCKYWASTVRVHALHTGGRTHQALVLDAELSRLGTKSNDVETVGWKIPFSLLSVCVSPLYVLVEKEYLRVEKVDSKAIHCDVYEQLSE